MNNCGRKPSVSRILYKINGEIRRISTEIIHYSLAACGDFIIHYSLAVYRAQPDKLQLILKNPEYMPCPPRRHPG